MTFDGEKYQKIIKDGKFDLKDLKHADKEPKSPQEHFLHVFMGGARLLIPNTQEYRQYDGLETGALASCTGFALYVPRGNEAILGIAHLAPSQDVGSVIESFTAQLREVGVDPSQLRQSAGFMEVIPGQTTYDKGKNLQREKIAQAAEEFRRQFPNFSSFPFNKVVTSVLSGHLSTSVKLLKDGRLAILGEGRAY